MKIVHLLSMLLISGIFASCRQSPNTPIDSVLPEMIWVTGGEFLMGTDDNLSYEHERPAHRVRVSGFWISSTEVTNRHFKKFVDATGYRTVAEKKPTWEELKKQLPPDVESVSEDLLVPGSLVFVKPDIPVRLNDFSQWWFFIPGANWLHPEGSGSDLEGRWDHPVVHVAYEDAMAYCQWVGGRLPTEAEWEFASRGGAEQQRYGLGDEININGAWKANTFQGAFPTHNLREDGFEFTAPVKSFPPNTYGLYDMIGNVWEWTNDFYDVNYFKTQARNAMNTNPKGPEESYDPEEPWAVKRVTKGGSFLCASDYCSNYRPSARQGTEENSGSSNIGFRVVKVVN